MSTVIDLDALIADASDLAPLSDSAVRLMALAARDQWSMREVLDAIGFDQVLTSRLLRVANSAAHQRSGTVSDVQQAVVRLGMAQVVSLAMGSAVRDRMLRALPAYGMSEGELWRHSVAAALAAECLPLHCRVAIPVETYTAALLHDFGKLLLSRLLSADSLLFLRQARERGQQAALAAEVELVSVHHAELAALVAQHWNLPEPIVRGVCFHHAPDEGRAPICDAVHAANAAAHGALAGPNASAIGRPHLQENAARRLGLSAGGFTALCSDVQLRFDEVIARYA